MGELTAQMIQRGRGAPSGDVAHRRKIVQDVRAAREKLTSSIGLERAFDYELVRLFAQYRVGASIPLFALLAAMACAATIWTPLRDGAVGFLAVLFAMAITLALSQRFLRQDPDEVSLTAWRRRFVLAEALQGASWVLAVQALAPIEASGIQSFILFILLIVAAITAMLSATIPAAVYAGFAPLSAWAVGFAWTHRQADALILALMTVSAQIFFVFLANRLYSSALTNLHARAEKDALFAELEQAKANSDEARRRAEEANLAKSRFLATMSHELRTPLNAILGFSEVMKNEVFGPHASPTYREYSGDIHGSGQHLLTLINEILDLSRIEAGRYELNEEALHLAYIVDDCRHMMNLRAKAKNQTVREAIDPSLPRLWADERAIRQIVLNLLSNAIKFTPQGGEITVKVGWTSSGGQYVSVKDTGPGIPEEEIPIVMSSFGRGSLAIKAAEQGSGLGLPIVKGLVDLHGGGFRLKSKPREGTEVIVTFPSVRVMNALPAVEVPPAKGAPLQAA
ncbi:MAG TPA: HAMP domain-containing sensor histidine kinase [Beijerinckiaceae bacterium]|jgi:two-component system, cell cycle sensor histidine kinase PleC|nr:HAMP domain-containing sensor histidine kinase [Beijerinckiaceae bacterium]